MYRLNKKLKYHLFAYWHDPRWKGFVGASVKIKDMAYNLAAMGNEVIIFLPKNRFKQEEFIHKIIEIPFIDLPFLRLTTFNIFLLIFLIIQLFKNSPSVVYVRRMNSVIPALYAKIAKAVLIYEINDDPYSENNKGDSNCFSVLRSLISAKQDQIILKICDKAFVITKEILDKLHKYDQNLKRNKLEIMPSGANTQLFKPLDKIKCRLQLKFKKENKIVGFAGTLLEHQGIGILIEAAAQITKKFPETIFLIIGEGPKKIEWIDLVKKKKLRRNFIFAGQIAYEYLSIWLNASDICVAPFMNSAGYRSPVKIFDYMACGKAVVASKLEGTTDVFENSSAIALVEAENSNRLAEKIIELLSNDTKAQEMGHKGQRFVQKNFDRKSFAKRVHEEAVNIMR